jgi:hypothetical protein
VNDLESGFQSFVIKVWLESTANKTNKAVWRGMITHVPSGERKYASSLDDFTAFIIPYLESMGIFFPGSPDPPAREN